MDPHGSCFSGVDFLARRERWACMCIVNVTQFTLCDFALGRLTYVLDDRFFVFEGVFSSKLQANVLSERAAVARSIEIVFGLPFTSITSICF